MNKLKINTLCAIFDIVAAVIYFLSIGLIFISAFSSDGDAQSTSTTLLIFALIGLVLHIVGTFQSRKKHMNLTGHILGIIGHGIYCFIGAIASIPAMVLIILACIFIFKYNKSHV